MKPSIRFVLAGGLSASALAGCGSPCKSTLRTLVSDNSRVLQCCGDARQYEVAQADNGFPVDLYIQVGSGTPGGPTPGSNGPPGVRLTVVIEHCDAKAAGDCAPLPDRTVTAVSGGLSGHSTGPVNELEESVSGQNIRLALTVTDDADDAGDFYLHVTQGHECASSPL
jgi:hypothetical protein